MSQYGLFHQNERLRTTGHTRLQTTYGPRPKASSGTTGRTGSASGGPRRRPPGRMHARRQKMINPRCDRPRMDQAYAIIRCPHCGGPAHCTDMKYNDSDGDALGEYYLCGSCGGRYSVVCRPERSCTGRPRTQPVTIITAAVDGYPWQKVPTISLRRRNTARSYLSSIS